MALLHAILTLIVRSLGRMAYAVFGWAVVALFGRTAPGEQTFLSVVVALASLWPVLLLGVAFPRIAAFALAFVPLSEHVPAGVVRPFWVAGALAIPLGVGVVIARRGRCEGGRLSLARSALRGFQVTFALSAAFLLMFVTVPVLRLASALRGRTDEHVPCMTDSEGYARVADDIDDVLRSHRLDARRTTPSWWLDGPARVLRALGGTSLRGYLPRDIAYWSGPGLELAFYPSDLLIRGRRHRTAWLHGVLAERLARGPGLQTYDARAQALERTLLGLWRDVDDEPRPDPAILRGRLRAAVRRLADLHVPYRDWHTLYCKALQLDRALRDQPPLLCAVVDATRTPATENGDRPSSSTWSASG